jgi:hypothetical protein
MRFRSMRRLSLALICMLWGSAGRSLAEPFPERDLPTSLRPWAAWVLDEVPDRVCPARGETAVCLWPGRLQLDIGESGGSFRQEVRAEREGYLALPGSDRIWPQGVTLDGRAAVVVERAQVPSVRLAAGTHVVAGTFVWKQMPDSLPVPQATALVDLGVRGVRVAIPSREADGLLWLRRGGERGVAAAESLRVQVYRRLSDGVPLFVDTQVALEVSGKAREIALRGIALEHSVPVFTAGTLPVQLDRDGRLRVQVRAGKFTVSLLSRLEGNPDAIVVPRGAEPWPESEVWVFAANESLRQVQVSGGSPIDPSRTDLPEAWRKLPAFALTAGARLTIKELQRGEPEAAPDRITLRRELWLDIEGRAFTARDSFAGSLSRTWRLTIMPPAELGRANVGGTDELVTAALDAKAGGFELRRAPLDALTESRIPRSGVFSAALPAVGWAADVESLSATLHLPPGWSLLLSTGVDQASGSWVSNWTLLGFFLLLLIATGVARLFGWRAGLVALAGVGLAYHEAGAPLATWLSVLAATAVLTAQPQGRWGTVVRVWWWTSAVVLALVLAVFVRDQLRAALFPQVSTPYESSSMLSGLFRGNRIAGYMTPDLEAPQRAMRYDVPVAPPPPPAARPEVQDEAKDQLYALGYVSFNGRAPEQKPASRAPKKALAFSNLSQDPHSALQTGPAIPRWSWRSVGLSWSGPVSRDHRMRLVLLSPRMNLLLTFVRLTLLLLLAARILGLRLRSLGEWLARRKSPPVASTVATLLIAASALIAGASEVEAQDPQQANSPARSFAPSQELLEELKTRLTRPAACAPDCVSTSLLRLSIAGERLTLSAEVHADAQAAWAVPGPVASWVPSEVRLDGRPGTAIARLDDGFLYVRLTPGVHRVEASGPLPPNDSLTLQLKDRPRRATALAAGWDVAGIREDGPPDESIQLSRRLRAGQTTSVAGGHHSSWLKVVRTLEIGVSWRVRTIVRRVSPVGVPVAARIPLLPGESLTEGEWPTEKGAAAISLSRDQTEIEWASTLAPVDTLTLTAARGQAWSEIWRVQCGVVWQCRFEGIPPVRYQIDGTSEPEFHPWPGERLALHFTRPSGIAGPTMTIDRATLEVAPGTRLETSELTLWPRASREDAITIALPEGANVQEVKVGGAARPIRPSAGRLSLTVPAGATSLQVRWQRENGMSVFYSAPRPSLSLPAANVETTLKLPEGRFVLLARGPAWGPAVLFWPYLLLIVAVALVLGRLPGAPLTTGQWLLLGLGLTQTSPIAAAVVVGLPFALAWRVRRPAARPLWFNLAQLLLILWALVALGCLYSAVETGLLLRPEMQVAGYGSSDTELRWYADRIDAALPQVSVITLPLWAYRVSMLAWSLWLAASLLRAAVWAFRAWTRDGAWHARAKTSGTKVKETGAVLG